MHQIMLLLMNNLKITFIYIVMCKTINLSIKLRCFKECSTTLGNYKSHGALMDKHLAIEYYFNQLIHCFLSISL